MQQQAGTRRVVRAAGALAIVLALNGRVGSPAYLSPVVGTTPAPPTSGTADLRHADHRYRVVGKIRLALFWSPGRDIGNARLTWRSDDHGSAIALLGGSDPRRAPRRLNEWGYLREEIRSEAAQVFMMRSANGLENAPQPTEDIRDSARFSANCTSLTDREVRTIATTAVSQDATFQMFDRLLVQLVESPPEWNEKHGPRPAGVQPGFLTALQRIIQSAATVASSDAGVTPESYLYNGNVYDLSVRRIRPLGLTTVGERTFPQLARGDLAIRNRKTDAITKFAVTYVPGPSAVALPIEIFYRPNFWLSVELTLDENADVPADPAGDQSALSRIRHICDATGTDGPN